MKYTLPPHYNAQSKTKWTLSCEEEFENMFIGKYIN